MLRTWSSLNRIIQKQRLKWKRNRSHLMAPGSTVTSAAAIAVAILKVVESTTLTEPPDNDVALTFDNANVNG